MTLCALFLCCLAPMALADDNGKVCVNCRKTVDSVTLLACGEHSACDVCAKKNLSAHTELLPCGEYACDGKYCHNRITNLACPDKNHYACADPDATHVCEFCGKEYICASQANYHSPCRICGGHYCDGKMHCYKYDWLVGDFVCYEIAEQGSIKIRLGDEVDETSPRYKEIRCYEYTSSYAR